VRGGGGVKITKKGVQKSQKNYLFRGGNYMESYAFLDRISLFQVRITFLEGGITFF
jgi:hypothetical protein